jgi:hypothetical protein
VRPYFPARLLILALLLALAPRVFSTDFSELTEAQKRALFLQSREAIRPVPRASATPKPRPRPTSTPTPRPTPRPTLREDKEEATPTPRPHHTPEPEETPKPRATHREHEEEKATPRPKPTPEEERATPRPTPTPKPTPRPTPTPKPEKPRAPIVIEKSGHQEDEGYMPPPPKKRGWFLFGGGGPSYKYLTPSVRAAIDRARVKRGRWKYIVVHNSGTRQGNAKAFDNYHRKVRHMPNGLAYHFVIGNGSSSGNGEIEIGNRWTRQINGGHVHSDYLNNISLGICLVGDFNRDVPTKAQLVALQELIDYLRRRCGKVKGHDIIVYGHKQINPRPTDCPGDRFPLKWLNREYPIPK